ncbi:MAG TPA: MBL fold metallo-hydrolase [Bryobacteraceae bacterium]|nr:MBL fold metallo-hydrolase [Bryobacteraceae bacterium]
MKRVLIAAAFVVCMVAAFRRDAASQSSLVHELAPGVYFREAEPAKRIIANTGWVVFRDYVLVIDANYPWGARAILPDIKKTTDKPIRFVFDTHYHADHAFGDSVFVDAGATIVCSQECTAESLRKNPDQWNNDKGTGDYSLKPYRLEHPQISFQGRMVLDDGTHRVELIRVGPGHTIGDSVAWLPKERILFTGDLVVNRPGNNLADPDADPDGWVRALDDLAMRPVAIVIPGHGAQGTADAIRGDRDYLADMIQQVRSGIARGASAEELAGEIQLTQHKPWGENENSNKVSIRAIYAKLKK